MRRPLTTETLFLEMQRLNSVFNKFANAEELSRATAAYKDALGDFDLELLQGAVGLAIKLEPRFPYPAKLREHARAWGAANRPELPAQRVTRDGDVVCPVCGAGPRWAWLQATDVTTGEARMVKRCLAPCDPTRHPKGSWYVPMPENFVEWIDDDLSVAEFMRAQPARLTGEP